MNVDIDRAWNHAPGHGWPVRLNDGTLCHIRPIGPDDSGTIQACFAGLSAASRRLRFFGAKQALTESDLKYLTSADGCDHLAFAAVRSDAGGKDMEVLGAARCIRATPGAETAELAMAVVDHAQGNGVGTALLDHLIDAARAQGIRRFRCEVLADNEGMRALAKRLGGHASWLDDGALEYHCALPDAVQVEPVPQVMPAPARLPEVIPRPTARSVPEAWVNSWERAVTASIAVFETAAMAWYDCVYPGQFER